jgi:hypothetical protein
MEIHSVVSGEQLLQGADALRELLSKDWLLFHHRDPKKTNG